ncbi:hypothetical protein BGZ51_006237 [Haplosporangium sp. Z 767]|nr:hypothetical protein BGZ51_006237 [Haplosporangium sp. Z 767]
MSQLSAVDSVTGARERIGDLLRDVVKQVSYQILDILGYGTYGSIYLAKTVSNVPGSMPEYKAIKCLSKKGLSPTQLLLQRQEIDIHLSLSSAMSGQHPHIVDMASVIENKDSLYLVMEYCSGGDLYDAITSQHAAPRDSGVDFAPLASISGRCLNVHSDSSVLDAMTQIISALAHAHTRQVFHRDLKPENILVANDGTLKLADFGLATKDRVSTDFGCGSSFYMAPEQQPSRAAAGRRPYLPAKSDVWSLGIIFLNLRFGRNPWKLSRVDMDATFAAYAQNPDVLREMFPDLSASALHFLQRVLCVDPNDRADCFEALELIRRIDSIIGDDVQFNDVVTIGDCNEQRAYTDLTFEESSFGYSQSSGSDTSSTCSDEEDDEEDEIDSMFRMEDDYGAHRSNLKQGDRALSSSSSWSLATSHHSVKSWSDMVEEDEMDFSMPVEFDEVTSTDAACASSCEASDEQQPANKALGSSNSSLDDNSNTNTNNNNNNNNTITKNNAYDLDDDYTHTTNHTLTYYPLECHDSNNYINQTPYQKHQYQNSQNHNGCQMDPSWSSSSTWINDDLCTGFAQAGFTKLSELMFPSDGSPRSCPKAPPAFHSSLFSFTGNFLSHPP